MPDDVLTRSQSTVPTGGSSQEAADAHDLAGFGYKQELKRILGVYSSFAVAFSYISPSTGIFTLFAPIGLAIAGPFFFWSWPLVALGQFIIALNFAEVSSHFPVAGSVYQWTKYLSNRAYSWMTGWVYLFAGILTVTGVVATVPGLVLIPLLNNLGIGIENIPRNQVIIALLVLASTTILNIFGVRLVALINNTGVVFEIIAIADMRKFVTGAGAVPPTITSPADVLNAVLPGWMANVYLLVVLAAIYVCCLAIQTSTIRLAFGMARDGKLPLARYYNKVSPTLHTPVITCLVVGALAALPFIYYAGAGLIAIVATGMIYLSYMLGNIAILLARLRGWPTQGAPFKLGGWGPIINLLGLAWGAAMVRHVLWARPARKPRGNIVLGPGGASLGGFRDSVPNFACVVVLIVVVG